MSRPIPRIILRLPLAIAAVLGIGWLTMALIMRGPLGGQIKHDFGVVEIPPGGRAELVHVFHLANRTSKPLTINAARPDCGCLRVSAAFPLTVQPRQPVDLPVTMHFGGSAKTVLIQVDCGEAGVQNLWVSAAAQKPPPQNSQPK